MAPLSPGGADRPELIVRLSRCQGRRGRLRPRCCGPQARCRRCPGRPTLDALPDLPGGLRCPPPGQSALRGVSFVPERWRHGDQPLLGELHGESLPPRAYRLEQPFELLLMGGKPSAQCRCRRGCFQHCAQLPDREGGFAHAGFGAFSTRLVSIADPSAGPGRPSSAVSHTQRVMQCVMRGVTRSVTHEYDSVTRCVSKRVSKDNCIVECTSKPKGSPGWP